MSLMMDNHDGKIRAGQVLKEINKVALFSCMLFLMLTQGFTLGLKRSS